MWLFEWVLFCNVYHNVVDKILLPEWSWEAAVLVAMYQCQCQGCTKTAIDAIIIGCVLLLQL
jgi:hypothetical protein